MSEVIIVALIGAAASIAGSVFSYKASARKAAEQASLTIYRIDQLEGKVNKHNELIERTYKLEKKADVCAEKFKNLDEKISHIMEGR